MEKFDFTKIEDQEKFEELQKQEQEKIVGEARDEAQIIEKSESKEVVLTPEQETAKQGMIDCLSRGDSYNAIKIKDKFNLPEEIINSSEVQSAAKQGMIRDLSRGNIDTDVIIKDKFNLPEEILHSKEVQEAAKQGMINHLSNGSINNAVEIKDKFNLSEEITNEAAKQGMINRLLNGSINNAVEIKDKFNLPEEIVQQAVEREIKKRLFGMDFIIQEILELKNKFNIPEEVFFEIAEAKIIDSVLLYPDTINTDKIIEFKDKLNISEEIISSHRVQEAVKKGIINCFTHKQFNTAIRLKDIFNFSGKILASPEFQEVAKQVLANILFSGSITFAIEIKDKFNLPEEIVQEIAKQAMINNLSHGDIDTSTKIKDKFNLSEKITQEAAKQGMISRLSDGESSIALIIKDKFNLPEEIINSLEVQEAAKQGIIQSLSYDPHSNIDAAIEIKDKFNLPEEIVREAAKQGMINQLSNGDIDDTSQIKGEFSIVLSPEEAKETINLCINNNNMEAAMIFNNPVIDFHLEKLSKIFTNGFSAEIYSISKEISNGEINDEMRDIGITESGDKGIRQLAELSRKYTGEMVFEKENNTKKFANSPVLRELFASYIRFNSSQWGNHNDDELISTLETYENVKGEIEPLPEYMKPSGVIRIDTIDKEDRVIWSEQFLSRYNTLIDSIKEAKDIISSPKEGEVKKPFSAIAEEMQNEINILKNSLEEKLGKVPNEKAKIGLENRIKSLTEINPHSLKKFQQNISELYKFKELHSLIRKAVFAWSLAKNKDQTERMEKIAKKKPDIDTTSTLLDFIDHITNQETFEKYFTDKKSADAFNEIINTRAISQDFAKAQNRSVAGTVAAKFIPQRNVMTEFSGQIGDACWASKYDSILESFPNFSSVVMMQDPGGKNERLVGSCFLIETESREGEPLLVIRGLNPLENFINRLSIKDFYDKFMLYVKEIAAKDKRRVVIAVDDHSGGSGTNRPALYEYMASLWNDAEDAPLNDKDTNFNGYDISDSCMIVE